ncbi:MAG: reverse transcriptase family protein [Marinomonas foliarum]|uniref:reverse transcriptase family protein n=1 Tax=Marinomonas foliarum TaxID=491950 RepID=UPI003F99E185
MNHTINSRTLEEVFISTFHGKLLFDEFLNIEINQEYSKIDKGNRVRYSPSVKLKKIHRFINSSILAYFELNKEVVFSYRKGVSIRDAVEKHAKNKFFFQTDVKDFFSSFDVSVIKSLLEKNLDFVPISDIKNYSDLLLNLLVVDGVIPEGFPTSPMLSNACLFDFDNLLNDYCKRNDFFYSRYSDDIIISSNDKSGFSSLENDIQNIFTSSLGDSFILNRKKTKIQSKNKNVKILGFNILPNGVITISNKDKNEIEVMLNFYLSDLSKFDDYVKNKVNFKDKDVENRTFRDIGVSSLSGRIIAINSMDKKYLSKLRRKYGTTLVDMFLRKSVK